MASAPTKVNFRCTDEIAARIEPISNLLPGGWTPGVRDCNNHLSMVENEDLGRERRGESGGQRKMRSAARTADGSPLLMCRTLQQFKSSKKRPCPSLRWLAVAAGLMRLSSNDRRALQD